MSWAAVIVGGASLIGGAMANKGAKDAAKAGNKGAQAGIDEQRRQFDKFQENIDPYLQYGQGQLGQLGALSRGDYSGFENSPDYLYAQQAGTLALDRGATARGNLWGGGADADRIALGQGLATQYLNNYRNSLQWGAQLGQNSAVGAGSLGQSSANAISGLYGQMGQNNANAAIGGANAWGNALGGVAGAAGMYLGGRQSSYSQPAQGGYGAFAPNQGGGGGYSTNPIVSSNYGWMNGGGYGG